LFFHFQLFERTSEILISFVASPGEIYLQPPRLASISITITITITAQDQ
jgi:hypothetical protein